MDNTFHLEPDMQRSEKMSQFYTILPYFLPTTWLPRLTQVWVPLPGYANRTLWEAVAIVIATNKSEEDIKRAEDAHLVSEIQRIVGVKTAPGWHIVSPDM